MVCVYLGRSCLAMSTKHPVLSISRYPIHSPFPPTRPDTSERQWHRVFWLADSLPPRASTTIYWPAKVFPYANNQNHWTNSSMCPLVCDWWHKARQLFTLKGLFQDPKSLGTFQDGGPSWHPLHPFGLRCLAAAARVIFPPFDDPYFIEYKSRRAAKAKQFAL